MKKLQFWVGAWAVLLVLAGWLTVKYWLESQATLDPELAHTDRISAAIEGATALWAAWWMIDNVNALRRSQQ